MSHTFKVAHLDTLHNAFRDWKMNLYFSRPTLQHFASFVTAMLSPTFQGTLTDVARESFSPRDRRSLSHFLAHGKWDTSRLKQISRDLAVQHTRLVASEQQEPLFLSLDDTVCEKTKPSSQALFPMEAAAYHYAHAKHRKVYGHALVQILIQAGHHVFPYACARYKGKQESKVELAAQLLTNFPVSDTPTYVLMDSWYPSAHLLETCLGQGLHVISALKTNRTLYPGGTKQSIKDLAAHITLEQTDVVTVGGSTYRTYRYEGALNVPDEGVVVLCWKADEPFDCGQVRAFLSTDLTLSTEQILSYYSKRWAIETYFRTAKMKLGLDRYQVRSATSLDRFWALLAFACTCLLYHCQGNLLEGLQTFHRQHHTHQARWIYEQGRMG
ncbi:hypothetical protein HNR77_006108, partial [Paenibacillus sp. JGP012]|uniref:IS701 family transposase n=1 Tax=Paenibacillus sp. JGP012 TaxID=2735914 RepID=UPI001622BE77